MDLHSIPDFLDRIGDDDTTTELVVLNRTQPRPVQRLFEDAFGQEVTVSEQELPDVETDTVVLVRGDEVIATSPLESIMESFLLINSDTYRTSTRGIDKEYLPDVLANLDEVVMRLRGYPQTNKEKLLLIAVSRYIEALALEANQGRLDAAFQRLSRLNDEFGTRRVYERLAESAVEVHAYAVSGSGWPHQDDLDICIHTDDSEHFRKSWFVVYQPEDAVDTPSAALLAWKHNENEWRSTWTFDPTWVSRIQDHIIDHF